MLSAAACLSFRVCMSAVRCRTKYVRLLPVSWLRSQRACQRDRILCGDKTLIAVAIPVAGRSDRIRICHARQRQYIHIQRRFAFECIANDCAMPCCWFGKVSAQYYHVNSDKMCAVCILVDDAIMQINMANYMQQHITKLLGRFNFGC